MQAQCLKGYNEVKGVCDMADCPMQPDLNKLTNSVQLLAGKVDSLLDLHKWVIKWLLIVVCVIALGRSAIDLGKDWFSATNVRAELKK